MFLMGRNRTAAATAKAEDSEASKMPYTMYTVSESRKIINNGDAGRYLSKFFLNPRSLSTLPACLPADDLLACFLVRCSCRRGRAAVFVAADTAARRRLCERVGRRATGPHKGTPVSP